MNGFIQVTGARGERSLVNVAAIQRIYAVRDGTRIDFIGSGGSPLSLVVTESYENVAALVLGAGK